MIGTLKIERLPSLSGGLTNRVILLANPDGGSETTLQAIFEPRLIQFRTRVGTP